MTRVFIHPLAGVLSAYGMGLADVRALRQQAVEARLSDDGARGRSTRSFDALEAAARARGRAAGHRRATRIECRAHAARQVRRHRHDARGSGRATRSRRSSPSSSARYRQHYGFLMPGKALVIEAVAVEAVGHDAVGGRRSARVRAARRRRSRRSRVNRIYTDGAFRDAPVYDATTCGRATRSTARP